MNKKKFSRILRISYGTSKTYEFYKNMSYTRTKNRKCNVPLNDYSTLEQKVVFSRWLAFDLSLLRYPGWLCTAFISILIPTEKQSASLLYRHEYSYKYIYGCTEVTFLQFQARARSQQMNLWQKFLLDWVALFYDCVCANNVNNDKNVTIY